MAISIRRKEAPQSSILEFSPLLVFFFRSLDSLASPEAKGATPDLYFRNILAPTIENIRCYHDAFLSSSGGALSFFSPPAPLLLMSQ